MAEKIKTSDYVNLPIERWSVTTFRAYMKATHEERYGIPYTANNYAMEGKMLKNMQAEHGNEIIKRFIERCYEAYKPTNKYPGLNFVFMFSYMRSQQLPVVLKQVATEQLKAKRAEKALQIEIDTDWF